MEGCGTVLRWMAGTPQSGGRHISVLKALLGCRVQIDAKQLFRLSAGSLFRRSCVAAGRCEEKEAVCKVPDVRFRPGKRQPGKFSPRGLSPTANTPTTVARQKKPTIKATRQNRWDQGPSEQPEQYGLGAESGMRPNQRCAETCKCRAGTIWRGCRQGDGRSARVEVA